MAEERLELDAGASRVTVETRAKGMLAKLAHDLSIEAKEVGATASVAAGEVKVELRVPVARLAVDGVRRGGAVDRNVLSRSDTSEIERKIREEVLRGDAVAVVMSAPSSLEAGRRSADATGKIEVGGRSARVTSRCDLEVDATSARAAGRVKVSLPALGITPPKGPLGAFRVDDEVEVVFQLVFKR